MTLPGHVGRRSRQQAGFAAGCPWRGGQYGSNLGGGNGQPVWILAGTTSLLRSVAFSPDSSSAGVARVASTELGLLLVHEVETKVPTTNLPLYTRLSLSLLRAASDKPYRCRERGSGLQTPG